MRKDFFEKKYAGKRERGAEKRDWLFISSHNKAKEESGLGKEGQDGGGKLLKCRRRGSRVEPHEIEHIQRKCLHEEKRTILSGTQ